MEVWIAKLEAPAFLESNTVSYNVYFSGCSIRCEGCHNEELWDKESGFKTDTDTIIQNIKKSLELIDAVVILGGEPTDQREALLDLLIKLQDLNVDVWLYTGRQEEQVEDLKKYCTYIKIGKYKQDTKTLRLQSQQDTKTLRLQSQQDTKTLRLQRPIKLASPNQYIIYCKQ